MSEPYYYHYFGEKHTRGKMKKKEKLLLIIDVQESSEGALPVYLIQIKSQKYRGIRFNVPEEHYKFIASNGFELISDSMPEAIEVNRPDGRRYTDVNKLFVRGSVTSCDNDTVKVYGISYIVELKEAVKEYNMYCLKGA